MRGNAGHEAVGYETDPDSELLEDLLHLVDRRLVDEGGGVTPSSLPPSREAARQFPAISAPTVAKTDSCRGDGAAASSRTASWSRPSSLPPPPAPDARSYNACIAACRRSGKYGLARLFFLEMMSRGLRPDVWTFRSALLPHSQGRPAAAAKVEELESAPMVQMMSAAKRRQSSAAAAAAAAAATSASTVTPQEQRPSPRRSEAGVFWRQALLMLEEVDAEGLGPDPPCISLVLSECARAGRWEVRA